MILQNRLFGRLCAAVSTALLLALAVNGAPPVDAGRGAILQIGDDVARAQTDAGTIKGYVLNGVFTFLGVPYGADTGGANRFRPPQPVEPWEGVLPTVFYGHSAPQEIYARDPDSYATFVDHWNYDELSEDCLRLNLWTPALDKARRPVLVWLHGGGFTNGNGIEQDGYHGEDLSREGDIVFVSINHRLGALGFTDFSGSGDEGLADSGNVGLLDILAALQWVQRNIAQFGGDPENVTIIGQSGGGRKVCLVAAMPEARGLVHKGVALSGSAVDTLDQDLARALGHEVLAEAGYGEKGQEAEGLAALRAMPAMDYLALAQRALERTVEKRALGDRRLRFEPVADGVHLPRGTFFQDDRAPDLPMIYCTTFSEWFSNRTEPALEAMTRAELVERLVPRYGARSEAIAAAYAEVFPEATPADLWGLIISNRAGVVSAAQAKLAQKAPVYMAWFGWEPPLFDGRMRAFHCLDISFWLRTTDRMITHTGGGPRPRALSVRMSDALLRFMRTGDPNGEGLPQWPRFTAERGETMILDDTCRVENDPDGPARRVLTGEAGSVLR